MLKQRTTTALVLMPVTLGGIFLLPLTSFSMFIATIITLAAWEWAALAGFTNQLIRVGYAGLTGGMTFLLFSVSPGFLLGMGLTWWLMALLLVTGYPDAWQAWQNRVVRLLTGWLILWPAWGGLVYLKAQHQGNFLILYVLLVVWSADTGAYFTGKAFGKRKLAPHISPGKTREGVFGGLMMTSLVAMIAGWYQQLDVSGYLWLIVITLIVAMVSVLGDLLESMFKREAGLKDSSQLLPGHGGVMDRIDSLTAAVPVFATFWFLWTAMAT